MMMKRIGCMILVLAFGLLTACGRAPTEPKTDGFRCVVSLDYGGAVYKGTLDRLDPTHVSLTVNEPSALDGLSMSWDGEVIAMEYKGMSMSFDEASMPIGTAVKVLCRVLDGCRDGASSGTLFEGTIEGIPYTATFDDQTGMPLTLSLPSIPLKVAFSDWETPNT